MNDPTSARVDAEFLAALGEPTRLQIVELLLAARERTVTAIAKSLDVSLVTASHHLGILRRVGILTTREERAYVIYSLADGVRLPNRTLTNGRVRVSLPRERRLIPIPDQQ